MRIADGEQGPLGEDREDRADLLAACDVFCLPSRAEGLGVAALEAMAAGLVPVASRVGGVPDVIVDGESGLLVPHGDVDALSAAMRDLLENPDRRQQLARAGRERLMERFVFPRFVERLEENLRHILGDPPAGR